MFSRAQEELVLPRQRRAPVRHRHLEFVIRASSNEESFNADFSCRVIETVRTRPLQICVAGEPTPAWEPRS
jgi:hypothetical protein